LRCYFLRWRLLPIFCFWLFQFYCGVYRAARVIWRQLR
jgi:hypothetical protein